MSASTSEQRVMRLELQVSELQTTLKDFIAHHNEFAENVKKLIEAVAEGDHAGNKLLADYVQGVLVSTSSVWRLAIDAGLIDKATLCERLDFAAQHAQNNESKAFKDMMSFLYRGLCKGDDSPPPSPKITRPHLTVVK